MILPYFIIVPLLAAFLIALIAGEKDEWAVILKKHLIQTRERILQKIRRKN